MLENGLGGRQVVISTCDERLFQLARQKFAPFGNLAKLYRFVSIGRQGPIIEQE